MSTGLVLNSSNQSTGQVQPILPNRLENAPDDVFAHIIGYLGSGIEALACSSKSMNSRVLKVMDKDKLNDFFNKYIRNFADSGAGWIRAAEDFDHYAHATKVVVKGLESLRNIQTELNALDFDHWVSPKQILSAKNRLIDIDAHRRVVSTRCDSITRPEPFKNVFLIATCYRRIAREYALENENESFLERKERISNILQNAVVELTQASEFDSVIKIATGLVRDGTISGIGEEHLHAAYDFYRALIKAREFDRVFKLIDMGIRAFKACKPPTKMISHVEISTGLYLLYKLYQALVEAGEFDRAIQLVDKVGTAVRENLEIEVFIIALKEMENSEPLDQNEVFPVIQEIWDRYQALIRAGESDKAIELINSVIKVAHFMPRIRQEDKDLLHFSTTLLKAGEFNRVPKLLDIRSKFSESITLGYEDIGTLLKTTGVLIQARDFKSTAIMLIALFLSIGRILTEMLRKLSNTKDL